MKQYQAVYLDRNGRGFRVNGAIGTTEDEAVQLSQNHVAVKDGAELIYVDSWDSFDD